MRGNLHQLVRVVIVVAACATGSLVMLAGQQAPAAVFTAAQAAAGRTAYQTQCASCHLADLKGSGDAAQLAGSEFMDAWGRRTPRELLSFIQLTMPPTRPGALSQEEYLGIAAFILQSNGATAGGQALTPSVDVAINSIARGGAPAVAAAAAPGRGAPPAAQAAGGGRGRGAAGPPAASPSMGK
jgi:mono/diheme cytochrome c family protein